MAPQRRRRARRRIRIKVRLRGRLRLQEFTSAMSPFTIDLETQAKPLRTARREGQFGLSAVEGKDPMPIRRPSWFPKLRAEHVVQTTDLVRQRLSVLLSCQCCQQGPTGLRPEHAPKCRFRMSMRRSTRSYKRYPPRPGFDRFRARNVHLPTAAETGGPKPAELLKLQKLPKAQMFRPTPSLKSSFPNKP